MTRPRHPRHRLHLAIILLGLAGTAAACTRLVDLTFPPDAGKKIPDASALPDGFKADAGFTDDAGGPLPDASPFDASLVD